MTDKVKPPNRLRNRQPKEKFSEQEVTDDLNTARQPEKPARLLRTEVGLLLRLLQRVAAGGDATTAVDAAALIPLVQRGLRAAPVGHKPGRVWFVINWPSGAAERLLGAAAVASRLGLSRSHVQNKLSQGRGVAEFPCRDELGNPAIIVVRKAEEN